VKDFGLTNVQAGFVTAIPYVFDAIGMLHWGWHSDRNCERKWHVVISFVAMMVGLGLASITASRTIKMAAICVTGWGMFSMGPVFWTLPTAFLSGAGAAAGIAAINSIANLGGYFGPKIFGQLQDWTGTDFAGLILLSASPAPCLTDPSSAADLETGVGRKVLGHGGEPGRASCELGQGCTSTVNLMNSAGASVMVL
jgi:nitrate/nitrite transporter NarK